MAWKSIIANSRAVVGDGLLTATDADPPAKRIQLRNGCRAGAATDDGAPEPTARRVCRDLGSFGTVNQQLDGVNVLLSITNRALDEIYSALSSTADLLHDPAAAPRGPEGSHDRTQHQQPVADAGNSSLDVSYCRKLSIGDPAGRASFRRNIGAAMRECRSGGKIDAFGTSSACSVADNNLTQFGATTVAAAITMAGGLMAEFDAFSTAHNAAGAADAEISSRIGGNCSRIDPPDHRLGALVDADPGREFAQLHALQRRQQLGSPALSIASQSPQSLLKLFQ